MARTKKKPATRRAQSRSRTVSGSKKAARAHRTVAAEKAKKAAADRRRAENLAKRAQADRKKAARDLRRVTAEKAKLVAERKRAVAAGRDAEARRKRAETALAGEARAQARSAKALARVRHEQRRAAEAAKVAAREGRRAREALSRAESLEKRAAEQKREAARLRDQATLARRQAAKLEKNAGIEHRHAATDRTRAKAERQRAVEERKKLEALLRAGERPPPANPSALPAGHRAALLFEYDLDRSESVERLRERFHAGVEHATDSDLKRAREVVAFVEAAILMGGEEHWRLLRRAHAAVEGAGEDMEKVASALRVVSDAIQYCRQRPRHREFAAQLLIRDLARCDERFGSLDTEEVLQLVAPPGDENGDAAHPTRAPTASQVAAALTARIGAFGATDVKEAKKLFQSV